MLKMRCSSLSRLYILMIGDIYSIQSHLANFQW